MDTFTLVLVTILALRVEWWFVKAMAFVLYVNRCGTQVHARELMVARLALPLFIVLMIVTAFLAIKAFDPSL